MLYGCPNCLETFEFEKKICQEGLEQVYQYAIDYTDFYTLEITHTISNAEAATGFVNGFCLQDAYTEAKTCFAVINDSSITEFNF